MRDLVTRRMTTTESSNAILATTTAAVMLAGLATAPFGWQTPTLTDFGLMAAGGLFAGFGHHFMIEAFRHAEAVIVSPFRYVTIIWAVIYMIFMPALPALPGMGTNTPGLRISCRTPLYSPK